MTYSWHLKSVLTRYFNSHPHEEDDDPQNEFRDIVEISTHILTKRMTTHKMNSGILWRFQLTSSRRGWQLQNIQLSCHRLHFNSHPHEEDDVFCPSCGKLVRAFQLTSSRRGWRLTRWSIVQESYFNSHPHEEDDIASLQYMTRQEHFNSHPHEEDDWLERRKK